jgi:hypothetical protein
MMVRSRLSALPAAPASVSLHVRHREGRCERDQGGRSRQWTVVTPGVRRPGQAPPVRFCSATQFGVEPRVLHEPELEQRGVEP